LAVNGKNEVTQLAMRMRTILIGMLALVFGVSAAGGVYLMMGADSADVQPDLVSLVVAAADISRGQTLTQELLTLSDWPKAMVPEGAIINIGDILERTVAIPMLKGDLLLERKLAAIGSGRGLAAIIPAGMRAVTIQTPNIATGVAGFILPGNKVDVLLTMSGQGSNDLTGGGSTMTLLQNLEILAVDQLTDAPDDNLVDSRELRSVTLLVTPAEAARLNLGQNKGTLQLTLRNPTDDLTEHVNPITLTGLNLNSLDPFTTEPFLRPVEITPPAVAPVTPLPLMKPKKKFTPLIRTLRGTQAGLIPLQVQESEAPDENDLFPPSL